MLTQLKCNGHTFVFHGNSVLHISSNTLRHKLLGETQFKLDEAERLSTMLGLTMAERDACFFDAENRFSRSAALELPKRGKRQ